MKRLIAFICTTLPYVFVFIASIFQPADGDLGWHLKYGEYFYKHLAPLYTNTFSTMMPDYHWPNSSWVTDVISYTAYKLGGFTSLSILGALVVTATFFFISRAFKLQFFAKSIIFPILLYLEYSINIVSFRGQQLSLLFMAILLFILETKDQNIFNTHKKRYLLIPLLFFLWINTHGEFLLGFGILGLYGLGNVIQKILENKHELNFLFQDIFSLLKFWTLLILVSFLLTIMNPFGLSLYQEALTHIGNADLKYVTEYVPFSDLSTDWRNIIIIGSLLSFGVSIYFFNDTLHKKISSILIVTSLFLLSLWIKRFAWPFYYTTPAIFVGYFSFQKKEGIWSKAIGIFLLVSAITLSVLFNNPLTVFTNANWNTFCNAYIACSPKSADFLKKQKLPQPLWTNYNWGGYLIWNYPEIKPSIDGRMHLWKDEKGYSAFEEYFPLESADKNIENSRFNSAYVWNHKAIYGVLTSLVQNGRWKKIYDDGTASIFVRID